MSSDPPPYAWLEDPTRPLGPVGVRTTVVLGAVLGGVGLFSLAYAVFGGPDARAARSVAGFAFVVIGAVVVRMGLVRRAWRRRHPGLDPLEAATAAGGNVGDAFGDDSMVARVGRWVLVVVCAAVTLVTVLALRRAVTGETPTGAGAMVVILLLGAFSALVGVAAVVAGSRRR